MEKLVITGGRALKGKMSVSGAKNVALKVLVAACLTSDEVIIKNVPHISDVFIMKDIVEDLGGIIDIHDHTARIKLSKFTNTKIALDKAAEVRTSAMIIVPLLLRSGTALIPNPGGCRIGARPIDLTIEGLRKMGADISYDSTDGYFHAFLPKGHFHATTYRFDKNTHTGTETLILAACLAQGTTTLENAAGEPEIDDLIKLLNQMGARIKRIKERTIQIYGVKNLKGTTFSISPDRNEIVTFAIAALITKGDITIQGVKKEDLLAFLNVLSEIGAGIEERQDGISFYYKGPLSSSHIRTKPYPGFMTDWQAPWAVLMTQAQGESTIHETVFENRFGYVLELRKMGAKIQLYNPVVEDPQGFYNFNWKDTNGNYFHAEKIEGPMPLHNAVVTISDLRSGATLVLAALAASGTCTIFGVEKLDRGYEMFDKRLESLGADIKRVEEE